MDTDAVGRVVGINLGGTWDNNVQQWVHHGLSGPIPPELGNLSNLEWLDLSGNQLTGPIPPELGSLSNLQGLFLSGNQLSGPIPPELGSLSSLQRLDLWGNQLTGPIPPELGNLSNLSLSNLQGLELSRNQLSGPIPPELGSLSNLEWLELSGNQLSGAIPAELGNLVSLRWLRLDRNSSLSGPLPGSFTGLTSLQRLRLQGTQLCAPTDAAFQAWLQGIDDKNGVVNCGVIPPTVSLSASPASIERGRSATLTWSSTRAVSATIDQGIGAVPTSGSRRVSPTRTTTYRITVRGTDGQTASDSTTVTVTEPPASLAPADQDAFNDVFVGKRALTDDPNDYIDFISPGRFTEGSDEYPGSYTYGNTGSNTGTLTLNYDDGERCTSQLTFTSATSGRATFSCNDGTSGSSSWRLVEIPASGTPDLVIQTPSVSDSSPNAGGSFTFSATVRNQGNGLSASTTLRYYRSTDATITTSDTAVGTDAVDALTPAGTSDESISLTAPSTAGTYYYGACVDPVSGESNSQNNCSSAMRVTVAQVSDEDVYVRHESLTIGPGVGAVPECHRLCER